MLIFIGERSGDQVKFHLLRAIYAGVVLKCGSVTWNVTAIEDFRNGNLTEIFIGFNSSFIC